MITIFSVLFMALPIFLSTRLISKSLIGIKSNFESTIHFALLSSFFFEILVLAPGRYLHRNSAQFTNNMPFKVIFITFLFSQFFLHAGIYMYLVKDNGMTMSYKKALMVVFGNFFVLVILVTILALHLK